MDYLVIMEMAIYFILAAYTYELNQELEDAHREIVTIWVLTLLLSVIILGEASILYKLFMKFVDLPRLKL